MTRDGAEAPTAMASRMLAFARPLAIAHRGGAALRPENTLLAFEHALALGVDALECDVRLSRDGDAVLVHDATLDRTTDATGPVSALTADELSGVDAGYRMGAGQGFPFRGRGAGIPRLSELLDLAAGVPVIVEIKGDDVRAAERALDVVEERGAGARVVLAGFSQEVLARVRRRAPALLTSASRDEVQAALRRAYFRLAPRAPSFQIVQAPLRVLGRRVLSRNLVRVLKRAGIPVQAWIVDEVEDMRQVLDWGVAGLISDRPDRAVAVVQAWASDATAPNP